MVNKDLLIDLKRDRPIINILGEVCWGFKIENFEKKSCYYNYRISTREFISHPYMI